MKKYQIENLTHCYSFILVSKEGKDLMRTYRELGQVEQLADKWVEADFHYKRDAKLDVSSFCDSSYSTYYFEDYQRKHNRKSELEREITRINSLIWETEEKLDDLKQELNDSRKELESLK